MTITSLSLFTPPLPTDWEIVNVDGPVLLGPSSQVLGDVIQARAEELCQMILAEIRRAGFDRSLNSGVVLTGGGAILEGMPEIAEQIFDLPIRRGTPVGVAGLADHINTPVCATPVGVALYAHRNRVPETRGSGALSRVVSQLRSIFKEFF